MHAILVQNNITSTTRRLLVAAAVAAVITLRAAASAQDHETEDDAPVFLELDNPGDLNFNQLLGINNKGATAVSTSPFGCNNEGEIVGSFTDAAGAVHGFIWSNGRFSQFDAPGSSQTAAFGVSGTFINGINDRGDIVGFYSDGTKVHGFTRLAGDE
jgi:probable HAF family extracellular repeat protein